MKKNKTAHKTRASQDEIREIRDMLFESISPYLQTKTVRVIKGNKKRFIEDIQKVISSYATSYEKEIVEWQGFYKQYFGIDILSAFIQISPKKDGFNRLLIVAEGLTLKQVAAVVNKFVPISSYNYENVISDSRPKESYGRWVKNQKGGDDDLIDQSANDLRNRSIYQNVSFTTLLEEFLLMLKFFRKTKNISDTLVVYFVVAPLLILRERIKL